jgi:hypothetical protein
MDNSTFALSRATSKSNIKILVVPEKKRMIVVLQGHLQETLSIKRFLQRDLSTYMFGIA